jgi:hypothetical protein
MQPNKKPTFLYQTQNTWRHWQQSSRHYTIQIQNIWKYTFQKTEEHVGNRHLGTHPEPGKSNPTHYDIFSRINFNATLILFYRSSQLLISQTFPHRSSCTIFVIIVLSTCPNHRCVVNLPFLTTVWKSYRSRTALLCNISISTYFYVLNSIYRACQIIWTHMEDIFIVAYMH